jgi:AcrR family transcriptional regulator
MPCGGRSSPSNITASRSESDGDLHDGVLGSPREESEHSGSYVFGGGAGNEGPLVELCERVAQRAGVSAATVRKLFPRREALLAAGLDYVITSVPAPAAPAATSAGAVVDAVFDYFDRIGPERLWAAYRHADESAALRERVERIEEAVRPLISKLGGGDRSKTAFAKTLLDPLAYWRLRSSGIAAKAARTHTATALAAVISPKR